MVETLKTLLGTLLLLFRSRSQLQAEILVLRQQLIVLRRTAVATENLVRHELTDEVPNRVVILLYA